MRHTMNQDILGKIQNFFEGETKILTKGDMLMLPGQQPPGVSFLIEGVVEQYDITPEGNKIIVNIFRPPAFFPMSWAINDTPNDYFFAALSEVKLKRASAEAAVAFLQQNPDVAFDLLSRVYRGTDALLKRLLLAARGVASTRLTFELLIEAYRFGENFEDNKKLIRVKHGHLAERTGLARETVSRELHKLASDGFVTLTKKGIVVDLDRLQQRLDLTV
ncbi:Crp/Fnr family transcriptional regulator [Candidatus Saccharibacteria bacterium]|nr:MAG: Crp/Fnr family transcriptional regulator [Candidatus Saccharibacteria bacterium]